MRHFALIACAAVVALAAAGTADAGLARLAATDTETIQLSNGSGAAIITGRGALLGHIENGSVRITDLPWGGDTLVRVAGDDATRDFGTRTTEYRGKDVTFRVVAGNWRVRIVGDDIDVSAVIRGYVGLQGTDGRFSIDGGDPRPWPEDWDFWIIGG